MNDKTISRILLAVLGIAACAALFLATQRSAAAQSLSAGGQPPAQNAAPGGYDMTPMVSIAAEQNRQASGVRAPSDTPFVTVQVNQTHNWVNAHTLPGTDVTITLMRLGAALDTQTRTADGGGWLNVNYGGPINLRAGDVVQMNSSLGITASIDVIPMWGAVNVTSNTISGHIDAPVCPANVRADVWANSGPSIDDQTDGACNYNVHFGGYQVRLADPVALWYIRPDGNEVAIVRSALQVQVSPQDDHVWGQTAPYSMVAVTVTDSGLKESMANVADQNGSFNFQLYDIDIASGDTVTVATPADTVVLHVPATLTATVDIPGSTILGIGPANTTIHFDVWDGAPIGDARVTSGPTGGFSLFTDQNPWFYELTQIDRGRVWVEDADGEAVMTYFGAAQLYVNKYGVTDAGAAPGGRYVYDIHYGSNNAPAQRVVITDTLPEGVTYVGVSAPYSATAIGQQVVITAGFTHADFDYSVQLTVDIADALDTGDTITNTANIGCERFNRSPENATAVHVMQLMADDTDLSINKNARTGNPTPGGMLIYELQYNNNGNTDSSAVLITDTLPVSTTFVNWWADEGGWTLLESDSQVVWQRDSIPGHWGRRIFLQVQLDPNLDPNGALLHNSVVISAANDKTDGNNTSENDVKTDWPHKDLGVNKSLSYGSTVAGRSLTYDLGYWNGGNTIAHHVLLTDTLPAGVTYVDSGNGTNTGFNHTPYRYRVGNAYVWDLGDIPPGWGNDINVQVRFDDGDAAGTTLTNTMHISSNDGDDWPYDNDALLPLTLYSSGPNLVLSKQYNWNGPYQLQYTVRIENRGDMPAGDVKITDTYPLSTTFVKGWWQWTPGNQQAGFDLISGQQGVFWMSDLGAGDTAGFDVVLDLDNGVRDVPGLLFTNTAQTILPPGETNPADNTAFVAAFTGPDLYAKKTLIGGAPGAGQVITFLLEYGNRSDKWDAAGDSSYAVDVLPDGMTLKSATRAPDLILADKYLVWLNGRLNGGWRDAIVVTTQITTTIKPGTVLINTFSVHDTKGTNIEPYFDNNQSSVAFTIPIHPAFLPLAIRGG